MANVRAFLEKAAESLESASADLEAGRNNSCARGAYYACFQAAVAALSSEDIISETRWRHGFVQAQFAGVLIHRRKLYDSQLGSVLAETLRLRHRADYEEPPISARWSRHILGRASRFVEAIRSRLD